MNAARRRLLDAAIASLRDNGIAGTSARVIAAEAGVSQALVFYHFGTVPELIDAACRESAAEQIQLYRPRLAKVGTIRDLLALGRELHAQQRGTGAVNILAQVLAGARADSRLAAAARHALELWITEIEATLKRLLRDSPIAEVTSVPGLARAAAAAFVGIEMYEGADPDGAGSAFAALEQLCVLIEVADDLGPVTRRALHSRLRRGAGGAGR